MAVRHVAGIPLADGTEANAVTDLVFDHIAHAQPENLPPTMTTSADRYLAPDQRDFFYLTTLR